MYPVIDTLVLAVRALGMLAAFQAVGAYVFLRVFEREIAVTEATIRGLVRWSALAAVLLAALYYFLVPVRMAGGFSGFGDPVLGAIVESSSVEPAQVVLLIGAAILAVMVDIRSAFHRALCLIAAAVVVVSFALTGHTTIHDLRPLLAPLLILHVAAAAIWFGSLWPLRIIAGRETAEARSAIVRGFSRLAIRGVPVLFVCGLVMSAIFLASIDQVFTGYGLMLGFKLAGFAGVLAIANFNRTRLVPAIARGDTAAASRIRRVLIGEMLALAAVVVLTVMMTGFFAPEGLHGSFEGDH